VLVAAEIRKGWSRDAAAPRSVTDAILEQVGLVDVQDERVDTMPTGTARLVEVARALATQPRLLLLDEPSAGLNEAETADLGELLTRLAATGLGVLLVEHDMRFVMGTCAQIHVLDFGQVIASGDPDAIQANVAVRSAYLGTGPGDPEVEAEITDAGALADVAALADAVGDGGRVHVREARATPVSAEGADAPPPALELVGVQAGYGTIDVLFGVDLTLEVGQVHALLGPNGAGKSTALKVASGQIRPNSGEVRFNGAPIGKAGPDVLARQGLCLVPEGRGVFPNLTILENLRMATYAGTSYKDVMDRAFTQFPRLAERRKQLAGTLSGGEQQMLAMARALATDPSVLLLDELSMGLAPLIVGKLYEIVAQVAQSGVSVLVVEQFARTVLGIADRAAIMLHGRITSVGSPDVLAEELSSAYLGGKGQQ